MQQHSRAFKFLASDVGTAGEVTGFASVFAGSPDLGGDIVVPGAFSESLAEHKAAGRAPKMLYQHRADSPIGRWTSITETSQGLQVVGQLATKTQAGREVHELLKAGALDGLSIGYDVLPGGEKYHTDGVRVLSRLKLWEISLVTFPMDENARITEVKTAAQCANATELQRLVRERLGLSGQQARKAAGVLWALLRDSGPEDPLRFPLFFVFQPSGIMPPISVHAES